MCWKGYELGANNCVDRYYGIAIFFGQNESLPGSDINRQIIDWRTAWGGTYDLS